MIIGIPLYYIQAGLEETEPNQSDGDGTNIKFDASKFIEYPGFNAPVPSDMIDVSNVQVSDKLAQKNIFQNVINVIMFRRIESIWQDSGYYKMPPMQHIHSIEGLSSLLQDNLAKSYKRKRLKKLQIVPQSSEIRDDTMELESDEEYKSNENSHADQPMTIVNDDGSNDSADDSTRKSNDASCLLSNSSLNELKRKKEELLKALADNTFDQDSSSTTDIDFSLAKDIANNETDGSAPETIHERVEMDEPTSLPTISKSPPSTPIINGRLKETLYGTPLIQQVSPFAILPSSEKWSDGVSDVIDFENLPDAVGTYRKMSEIIRKVRVFTKDTSENSDQES